MNDVERQVAYFSCLIRLQRFGDDEQPEWRCSLEVPGTGEVLWFADLVALVAYLEACTQPGWSTRTTKKESR